MSVRILLTLVLALSAAFSFFLAGFAFSRERIRGALEFSGMFAASALYTLAYGLEISQDQLDGMLWALRFEYVGIASMCYFWLLFALRFTGVANPGRTLRWALALPGITVVALLWTDPAHHWFYLQTWVRADAPFPLLGSNPGPVYWVHVALSQLEVASGVVILGAFALRADTWHRRQAVAVALGSLFPWVAFAFYIFHLVPFDFDVTPLGTIGSGLVVSWSMLRFGTLELVPAARELAIDSLKDGLIVLDRHRAVADLNDAVHVLLPGGRLRVGERPFDMDHATAWQREIGRLVSRGEGEQQLRMARGIGHEQSLSVQCQPVRDDGGRLVGHVLVIRDVSETAALLERLTTQAVTDELTGLANRRQFFEVGGREVERARRANRPMAVSLFDLDYFKTVNDRFGHDAGDFVLRELSSRLRASMRVSDVVCRYGGEEMAILMPETDLETASHVAERCRLAVSREPFPWMGMRIDVTASIGTWAAVPATAEGLEVFISRADEALYRAKAAGRNRCETWSVDAAPTASGSSCASR